MHLRVLQLVTSALLLVARSTAFLRFTTPRRAGGQILLVREVGGAGPHVSYKKGNLQRVSMLNEPERENVIDVSSAVRSVNYFISRKCNYSCKFCFHTQKNSNHLPLDQAKIGLELLRRAGTEKINFAGGEPFLHPTLLGELCKTAHADLGMAVSIISNGSLITPRWMAQYGEFVDVLGVSCDSLDPTTNALIGRGGDANNQHVERVLRVRELCDRHQIKFKLNTVVCSLNWQEDMSQAIRVLDPVRWKVFQVLVLRDENSGRPGELRDARLLTVTDDQFQSFVDRHADEFDEIIVPEPNNVMRDSYVLLDEWLRPLDCSGGGKEPKESILSVGVERALMQAGFDQDMFDKRGGVYDWKRSQNATVAC